MRPPITPRSDAGSLARVVLLIAAAGAASCNGTAPPRRPPPHASPPPAPPPPRVAARIALSPGDPTFEKRPRLREELRGTPHRFYRFVNVQFAQRVCEILRTSGRGGGPAVNLHGDAHVEQYAVSVEERGLADFDASTTGPAAIDLLRFATSVRIVAHQRGWRSDADRLVGSFLTGYGEALDDPGARLPEPRVAQTLRRGFDPTPLAWLERMDSLITPMPPEKLEGLLRAKDTYTARIQAQNPRLPPGFFDLKRAGSLEMGVGSALERKYLARVEGPSTAPEDDVLLEVKQMSDLSGVTCLSGSTGSDPFRVMIGQSRLGGAAGELLGYLELDGAIFYVQKWRVSYTELRAGDPASPDELAEVAREVGHQLGRGHPSLIAAPHDVQLRAALRDGVRSTGDAYSRWSAELEREVLDAWEAFRAAPDPAKP